MEKTKTEPRRLSRRAFGGRLLAVTGGAAVAAHAAAPCTCTTLLPEATSPAEAVASAAGAPADAAPTTQAGIVAEKVRRVEARWGSRLSAAQRRRLPGIIGYHEAMLARIRAVPLTNADAPATVLKDRG
jgi:hypothetical protein